MSTAFPTPTREERLATLRRRARSIPLLLGGAALAPLALPVLLLAALAVDMVRDRSPKRLRTGLALFGLLEAHAVALLWGLGLALRERLDADFDSVTAHRQLLHWWVTTVHWLLFGVLGVELEVRGDAALRRGPFLFFCRHASIADTVLPVLLVTVPHRLWPRYVIKRELRADAAIDLLGPRIGSVFVDRRGLDSAAEIARVGSLADDLDPSSYVAIFPEGTRFSEGRRERLLARLEAAGEEERLAYARSLKATLPPRHGGPRAVIEGAPHADVVFCAHAGFEQAHKLHHLFGGALVGQRVVVELWRVPADEVPEGEAIRGWLDRWWTRIDEWVCSHHEACASAR